MSGFAAEAEGIRPATKLALELAEEFGRLATQSLF